MWKCLDKFAAFAGGFVAIAAGGPSAGLAVGSVVGAAGMIGFFGEKRAKHGSESAACLSKIRSSVLAEIGRQPTWPGVDVQTVEGWDWSLGEVLPQCMLDRHKLAAAAFDPNGFLRVATELTLAEIADREPTFLHPPARLFAKQVVAAVLTAANNEKEYFDTLAPDLWIELSQKVGDTHTRVVGIEAKVHNVDIRGESIERKIDELMAIVLEKGVIQQAAEHGIPEKAVRQIVERLGGEGIEKDDLVGWLEGWIRAAQEELARNSSEGEAFEAAHREAERLFREGSTATASDPFMLLLQKEQAESQNRQLVLLDKAIDFDLLGVRIPSAIEKLRRMGHVCKLDDPDSIAALYSAYASKRAADGRDKGNNISLLFAIEAYRLAIDEWGRERVPRDWAGAHINLGNALLDLGKRETGSGRLIEAVGAFHLALEEFTSERAPLDWALAQHNLGTAFQALGCREIGTAHLEEAISAYRLALKERTRECAPREWAKTQNNLGHALQTLAEREVGTVHLDEALSAFKLALLEWTRESFSFGWATVQNNIGIVLAMLGVRGGGTAHLNEAVTKYRLAQEEWTRELVPIQWAMAQNNLGNAFMELGKREAGTARLSEATSAYRLALEELMRDRVPFEWAKTCIHLGNALRILGEREANTAYLNEAASAYRLALEELTVVQQPYFHSIAHDALVETLAMIEKNSGTELVS